MKRFLIPLGCILAAYILHIAVRTHTVSLFLAPASIPILIATAIPLPALAIGGIVLLFELFSSFPQGSILFVFSIPFFTRYLARWHTPDASWKFFAYIVSTVSLQIVSLIGIAYIESSSHFSQIPFLLGLLQIIGTSVSTFVLALICHEATTHP